MPTIFKHKVQLGTFVFNDPTFAPNADVRCDILDGWYDTPEVNVVLSPRSPGADGMIIADRFSAKEKYLNLGGMIYSPDGTGTVLEGLLDQLWLQLQGDLDVTLTHFEVGRPARQMIVRVSGPATVDRVMEDGLRFLIPLVAADPYKYDSVETVVSSGVFTGQEWYRVYPTAWPVPSRVRTYVRDASTVDASVQITNTGTVNTYPIITVTGPLTKDDWYLVNETTGEELRFSTAVNLGQTLVVDNRAHTALLDGYPVEYTQRGSWFPLVPGLNRIRIIASAADPSAGQTVRARSAWR